MKHLELNLKKRVLLVEASNVIGFEYGGEKLELIGKLSELKEEDFEESVDVEADGFKNYNQQKESATKFCFRIFILSPSIVWILCNRRQPYSVNT